jgi:hypothetical protein
VDITTARVHEEGRQSWSPSGAYALDATPYRPASDNWATGCYRPGEGVDRHRHPVGAGRVGDERWAAHVESTGGLMASSDRLLSLDTWGVDTTRRLLTKATEATR